jgi:hypothetical protein
MKKIISLSIILIILGSLSLSVFASSDDSTFHVTGLQDIQWHYTDWRLKENNSYVYFKTLGWDTDGRFEVKICYTEGSENDHSFSTAGGSVTAFLTNYIYENYGKKYIRLGFKSYSGQLSGGLYGVWSPDSVGTNGIIVPFESSWH